MAVHIYRGRARYEELDPMGHVHNSKYYVYFEEARTDLARSNGYPYSKIEENGIIMPLSESKAQFMKPIKYDEEFIVEVSVEYIRNMSMKFLYTLKQLDGSIACKGHSIHAFLDAEARDFVEVPDDFREMMMRFV